ncbi:MAG: ferritin family protein [Clostridia bacterium]|nr:ferritin family protein [Clostridia bacterium]
MDMKTIGYVKQAIISEIEGYEFYKLAASKTRSDEIRETYLELAEEERKHVEWLEQLLEKLSEGDTSVVLEMTEAPPSPDFFNWEKLDREDPQTTISVFGIALQLEKASYLYYDEVVEIAEDEDTKTLFRVLAAWERAHYDTFNKQYKILQEAWWAKQRFSPY